MKPKGCRPTHAVAGVDAQVTDKHTDEERKASTRRRGLLVHSKVPQPGGMDGVNSLLCGPANALIPPHMKPVINMALLIKNETEEKQRANWDRRPL